MSITGRTHATGVFTTLLPLISPVFKAWQLSWGWVVRASWYDTRLKQALVLVTAICSLFSICTLISHLPHGTLVLQVIHLWRSQCTFCLLRLLLRLFYNCFQRTLGPGVCSYLKQISLRRVLFSYALFLLRWNTISISILLLQRGMRPGQILLLILLELLFGSSLRKLILCSVFALIQDLNLAVLTLSGWSLLLCFESKSWLD